MIQILERNPPRVIVRNGVEEIVSGYRDEPDCECYSLVELEFKGISRNPKCILINQFVHDENYGLVEMNALKRLRENGSALDKNGKFRPDSLFEIKPLYKGYPSLGDLPDYMDYKGTFALVVIDVDTPAESLLVKRIQRELVRRKLICETRTQIALQKDFNDQDSTSVWLKLTDTRSFKFPEHRPRKK